MVAVGCRRLCRCRNRLRHTAHYNFCTMSVEVSTHAMTDTEYTISNLFYMMRMKLTQAHIHMNAHSHPSLSLGTFFVVLHSSLTRGPTNSVRSDRSFPLSSIPQALAIPLCHSLFVYTEALPNTSARQWRSCTEANTFRRCCWSYIVVCRYILWVERACHWYFLFNFNQKFEYIWCTEHGASRQLDASRDRYEESERHTDGVGWLFSILIL